MKKNERGQLFGSHPLIFMLVFASLMLLSVFAMVLVNGILWKVIAGVVAVPMMLLTFVAGKEEHEMRTSLKLILAQQHEEY